MFSLLVYPYLITDFWFSPASPGEKGRGEDGDISRLQREQERGNWPKQHDHGLGPEEGLCGETGLSRFDLRH